MKKERGNSEREGEIERRKRYKGRLVSKRIYSSFVNALHLREGKHRYTYNRSRPHVDLRDESDSITSAMCTRTHGNDVIY